MQSTTFLDAINDFCLSYFSGINDFSRRDIACDLSDVLPSLPGDALKDSEARRSTILPTHPFASFKPGVRRGRDSFIASSSFSSGKKAYAVRRCGTTESSPVPKPASVAVRSSRGQPTCGCVVRACLLINYSRLWRPPLPLTSLAVLQFAKMLLNVATMSARCWEKLARFWPYRK